MCSTGTNNVLHFDSPSLEMNTSFLRLGCLDSVRETVLSLLTCRGCWSSLGPLEWYYGNLVHARGGQVGPLCLKPHLRLPLCGEGACETASNLGDEAPVGEHWF